MYFLVLILPLCGSLIVGLGGRSIGYRGSAFLSTFLLILTWILALFIFYEVCLYQILLVLNYILDY